MQIQLADLAGLDTVSELRLAFVAEVRGLAVSSLPAGFAQATRDSHRRCFSAGRLRSWLAVEEAAVLGVVSELVDEVPARPEDDRHHQGFILNLCVRPSARGRGIGRQLMQTCIDDAARTAVRMLGLHTTDDGRPLYESLGFRADKSSLELPLADNR